MLSVMMVEIWMAQVAEVAPLCVGRRVYGREFTSFWPVHWACSAARASGAANLLLSIQLDPTGRLLWTSYGVACTVKTCWCVHCANSAVARRRIANLQAQFSALIDV